MGDAIFVVNMKETNKKKTLNFSMPDSETTKIIELVTNKMKI